MDHVLLPVPPALLSSVSKSPSINIQQKNTGCRGPKIGETPIIASELYKTFSYIFVDGDPCKSILSVLKKEFL